jgi:5-methylcytosine-specific restriction endonuclease McrA
MENFVIKEGVHFIGKPCGNCGGCVRYVKDGRCVVCRKEWSKQRYESNPDYRKQLNQNRKDKHEGLFFEGDPCNKHGNCLRYVSDGSCVLCRKEHNKQYHENNPDYDKQNAKQRRQRIKEENKDKGIYYEGDPCVNCGGCIRYVSCGACVLCTKEKQKERQQNNPEKMKSYAQNRRALKQNAEGSFTAQEWIDLCDFYENVCLVPGCENTDLTADHVIPLSKGGTNWITNIQPLCSNHNSSKHTKMIDYRQKDCQNCTIN